MRKNTEPNDQRGAFLFGSHNYASAKRMELDLNGSETARIDEADWHLVVGHKWRAIRPNGRANAYAVSENDVLLHRLLMAPDDGMVVDHIDGDGLNNTRANLRVCTHRQNRCNQKRNKANTSGVKGASRIARKKPWKAAIFVGRKCIHLGTFATKDEAAQAYAAGAQKYHGEFAKVD